MPEWWSYTLSDFLLFSPRTYYRLIERYNAIVWPAHVITLGLGLGVLGLLRRPTAWRGRMISSIIAILWAWIAWAFLWERYSTINWAAIYLIPLFVIEVLLLGWHGVVRRGLSFHVRGDAPGILGVVLLSMSLTVYPTLAPLLGRTWYQAEVFGIAPDPMVIATLGLVLLAEGRVRWELQAVPVLWCLISGLTLWAMGSPEAVILASVALLALLVAALPRRAGDPESDRLDHLDDETPVA
jgi:hypothetical protein